MMCQNCFSIVYLWRWRSKDSVVLRFERSKQTDDNSIICDGLFLFIAWWVRYGSDLRIRYGRSLIVFLLIWLSIMVCDLSFNSHILLCLCITLIFILYVIGIKCVYGREYYEYSLTANKSLLLLLLWEHLISVHSHQHPTCLLLATHFQLQLLLISVTVIHWIMAHMTLQAYILLVVCLLYKELQHTALGYSLG